MISQTSQNDLISCCGQFITELVVRMLKENQFFFNITRWGFWLFWSGAGISSYKICWQWLCYKEEFLGFLHCDLRLSGKALPETVLGGLINLGLDISNCRGQGYDGAAAISGHING